MKAFAVDRPFEPVYKACKRYWRAEACSVVPVGEPSPWSAIVDKPLTLRVLKQASDSGALSETRPDCFPLKNLQVGAVFGSPRVSP
jgi:hypothetical protein